MNDPSLLGLIINTWNQPEYLGRVLKAVALQSSIPNEVLLADDGSDERTRTVFANWVATFPGCGTHVWQEHQGFRRARILNQAIAQSESQYLVFLDGDTVPHPEFVADHRRLARSGTFIQGHRALVKKKGADWFGSGDFARERRRALFQWQLQGIKHAYRWPRAWQRRRRDLRGIRGCNLAIWRDHLVQVNGYNEDFIGWGREDSELAVRLMNLNVERIDVRGWALCYHLWHPPASRTSVPANDERLAQAQRDKATRCSAGLDQHLRGQSK
jgi:glycosyltransferase involved in cell wall biosynthesis